MVLVRFRHLLDHALLVVVLETYMVSILNAPQLRDVATLAQNVLN
jgi:hypothetical protein